MEYSCHNVLWNVRYVETLRVRFILGSDPVYIILISVWSSRIPDI